MTKTLLALLLFAAALVLGACGNDDSERSSEPSSASGSEAVEPVIDPGDGGHYDPQLDPKDFVAVIDNPFLPLTKGSKWVYEGPSDGGVERVEVTVTGDTKVILGITATVVRDVVRVDGEVVEDTLDWFAQDKDGNVWYLGEAVKDIENGKVVSTEGSFEAGVDGAKAGLVMPADPTEGFAYRQEFKPGEAEDLAEIVQVTDDRLTIKEWNPLEPDVVEEKVYERGVGQVEGHMTVGGQEDVELVEHRAGG